MITEPTVFVLGAGASCPYRYPSGEELGKQIQKDFVNQLGTGYRDNSSLIEEWGIDLLSAKEKAAEFVNNFRDSHLTIDGFLAKHQKDLWINRLGKLAIILRILDAEQQHKGHGVIDEKQNWYKVLLRKLVESTGNNKKDFIERFKLNRVTIATFNYDRSLDYTLFRALQNDCEGITSDEVIILMKYIRIIHMHG